jgi:hypothetical protein
MKTIVEIKSEIDRLAAVIGASGHDLPTYKHSADAGRPHIEVADYSYHYVIEERGQEISRFTTTDLDELLFQTFRDTTFRLACNFEVKHRVEMQDCRRIMFDHQVHLLSLLSPAWAAREAGEHKKILADSPFDDFAGFYASRIAENVASGHSYESARKLAGLATATAKLGTWWQRLIGKSVK